MCVAGWVRTTRPTQMPEVGKRSRLHRGLSHEPWSSHTSQGRMSQRLGGLITEGCRQREWDCVLGGTAVVSPGMPWGVQTCAWSPRPAASGPLTPKVSPTVLGVEVRWDCMVR